MDIKDYTPIPVPEANVAVWRFCSSAWVGYDEENAILIGVSKFNIDLLQSDPTKESLDGLAHKRNGWTWNQIVTKAFNLQVIPKKKGDCGVTKTFTSLKGRPKKKDVTADDQSLSATSPKIRCPQIADRLVAVPRPFKGKPWRDIYREFPQGGFYGWTCDIPAHNGTLIVWAKHLTLIQDLNDKPGYVDMVIQCFFEPLPSEPMHKAVVPGPHGDAEYAELEMVAARVTQGIIRVK